MLMNWDKCNLNEREIRKQRLGLLVDEPKVTPYIRAISVPERLQCNNNFRINFQNFKIAKCYW